MAIKEANEPCAPNPCSDDALTLGVCGPDLSCLYSFEHSADVCLPRRGYLKACAEDDDCAQEFFCLPWAEDAMGTPDTDRCLDYGYEAYDALVTPAWYATTEHEFQDLSTVTEQIDAIYQRYNGLCVLRGRPGDPCDPASAAGTTTGVCAECAPGLVCHDFPGAEPPRCARGCAVDDDCCDLRGDRSQATPPLCNAEGICESTCIDSQAVTNCSANPNCCDPHASCQSVEVEDPDSNELVALDTVNVCCRPVGAVCTANAECCPHTECVAGRCERCAYAGEDVWPGDTTGRPEFCCGGALSAPDAAAPPGSSGPEYCIGNCQDGDTGRAGEECGGGACGPNPHFDEFYALVCLRNRYVCVPRDSHHFLAAWDRGQLAPEDLLYPDANCDCEDDDCDAWNPLGGGVDEDFGTGAECTGVPGPPDDEGEACGSRDGVKVISPTERHFYGFAACLVCSRGPDCRHVPGVHYCAFGDGDVKLDERCSGVPPPPGSLLPLQYCDVAGGPDPANCNPANEGNVAAPATDYCRPDSACACQVDGGIARWRCIPRDEDHPACPPKVCWDPEAQPTNASLHEGHPALSCPVDGASL